MKLKIWLVSLTGFRDDGCAHFGDVACKKIRAHPQILESWPGTLRIDNQSVEDGKATLMKV